MNDQINQNDIEFNYFLKLFNKEVMKRKIAILKTRLSEEINENDSLELLILANECITKEEQIDILNKSLNEILITYLSLSGNEEIVVLPKEPLQLYELILNTIKENKYKYSLLISLQFIICEYLKILNKGEPTLRTQENESNLKEFTIVYDSNHRILDFQSTNLDLEEQNDTMLKILKLSLEDKSIDLPNVKIIERKDI